MRRSDSPFVADWFVVSLRWLVMLGVAISLALGDTLFSIPNLLLFFIIIWNVILTILAGLSTRMPRHREICVGVDILVTGLYFWLQGGFASPASWVILLPLLSGALYYETKGSLIVAALIAAIELAYPFARSLPTSGLVFYGAAAVVTFMLAGLFGYLSNGAIRNLRHVRKEQLRLQKNRHRMESERLRAIYELTSTLTATLNYQRVLDTVLDLSLSAVNPDQDTQPNLKMVSVVLLFSPEDKLEVGSARRFTPADMRTVLPGKSGAIAEAMNSGEPVLIDDISKDPEINHFVSFRQCSQVYVFPIRSGFNVYGVLVFGHPDAGYFTQDRTEVLDILGRQSVIAIANARLYQELVDERDKMVEVQEEARRKLARDLHDGPTQSVSAIAMRVNIARRMLEKKPLEAGEELAKIEELARRTTKEIRHMLFTLRPLVLESQGLVAALNSMAEKLQETYNQDVQIQVDENLLDDMEIGKQGVIFFIVEEAVNNARKHAQAAHIWVRMRMVEKGVALLEIQDDGIGFDVEAVTRSYDQRGSLGMINLRERTELVNGVLNIQSTPGKGTRIQVAIPLTEDAADRLHHAAGKR